MERIKVLHIITVSFSINYFFGKQFSYLSKKKGFQYHLGCCPSDEFFKLSKELDYVPLELPITRDINPIKDLKAVYTVYNYIKKNTINKVVGHTPKGGMVAMIASFLARVPDRIYFRHGIIYETSSGFKRLVLKNIDRLSGFLATRVVCVSKSVESLSVTDCLNNSSKNIVLGLGTCNGVDTEFKYNPISYDFIKIQKLKADLNIKDDDFVVGFIGRLVKDKGIDELILAWNILKMSHKNIKLLLIGPIEDRDSISNASKNIIQNDKSIVFTGFILNASIYYTLMNVFILPTYREGFPTVALEASSMRVPVLITNSTGCTEAIIENKTGFLISHQPLDIVSKINYYIENKSVAIEHGINGRHFVSKNFEQTKIWDLIDKVLHI